MTDNFSGDTPHLIRCIEALLKLDEAGSLTPHRIPGHARTLLEACAVRLAPAAPKEAQEPLGVLTRGEGGAFRVTANGDALRAIYAMPPGEHLLYASPSQPQPAQAARDVLAERARQISAEGWTPEHDDEHDRGEMARAAACYALHAGDKFAWSETEYQKAPPHEGNPELQDTLWPWDAEWWKPKNPRRDLVRAAALILAEIERIDRSASPQPQTGTDGVTPCLPTAWLHTVKQHGGDGTEDQALSFKPDNFPLQGEAHGMFYSVGQPRPLYLHPPTPGVEVPRG